MKRIFLSALSLLFSAALALAQNTQTSIGPGGGGGGGSALTVSGTSGALQTNNGSGGLGSILPGSGVAAALADGVNGLSGFPTVYAAIVTGHCLMWGPGVEDAGAACGGGSGTVTSVDTTCPTSANSPVSGVVTITGGVVVSTKTATYAVLSSDCGSKLIYNSASAGTFTLPTAASGFFLASVQNIGAGTLTVAPPSGTINGAASIALATNQSAGITTDGTNYFADGGTGGSASAGGSTGAIQYNSGSGFGGSAVVAANDIVTGNGASGPQDSGVLVTGATTASAGSLQHHPGYVTGGVWYPTAPSSTVAGAVGAANVVNCAPGVIASPVTIKALGDYFSAGVASGNGSFAIYTSVSGRPGALIDYATATEPTAAGDFTPAMHNTTDALKQGAYWFCFTEDNATAIAEAASFVGNNMTLSWLIGSATLNNVAGTTDDMIGISCTAGTNCGTGFTVWTTGAFVWTTAFSGPTWTDIHNAETMPFISMETN